MPGLVYVLAVSFISAILWLPAGYAYEELRTVKAKTTADVKSLARWRKWRDQHSSLWFLYDWTVRNESDTETEHYSVRIMRTPGALRGKAGEQAVLKIFDKKNRLVYCSDNGDDVDELCYGKPISILRLDDKMAILSDGPRSILTTVFLCAHGKIQKVLETGSLYQPEFVLSKEGKIPKTLIITNHVVDRGKLLHAYVYTWDSIRLKYIEKGIPFSDRLNAAL